MSFMGKEGFVWWIGVVEDRQDPLYLGRCRVRIYGWHTDNKIDMPTSELPWCTPIQPITSAAMTGVGTSPLGPVEGTWVVGFYRDGDSAQEPMMFGTLGGIPDQQALVATGFFDPRGDPTYDPIVATGFLVQAKVEDRSRWPRDPHYNNSVYKKDGTGSVIERRPSPSTFPDIRYLGEPTTPRLSRGEADSTAVIRTSEDGQNKGQTIIELKQKRLRQTGIPRAKGGAEEKVFEYNEPTSFYDAVYPYNHVHTSESGHVIEVDDTPEAERLHWFHRSGTNIEIGPDGTRYEVNVNDKYDSIFKNRFTHVNGDDVLTIDKGLEIFTGAKGSKDGSFFVKAYGGITLDAMQNDIFMSGISITMSTDNFTFDNFVTEIESEIFTSNNSFFTVNAAASITMTSEGPSILRGKSVELESTAGTFVTGKTAVITISDDIQEIIRTVPPAKPSLHAKQTTATTGIIRTESTDGALTGGIHFDMGKAGAVSSLRMLPGGVITAFNTNGGVTLSGTGDYTIGLSSGSYTALVAEGDISNQAVAGKVVNEAMAGDVELKAGKNIKSEATANIESEAKGKNVIEGATVELGKDGKEQVILGNKFIEAFSKHVHGTGTGPSSAVTDASPYAQTLSKKVFSK